MKTNNSSLQKFGWESLGIEFSIAKDFVVKEHTDTDFEARSEDDDFLIVVKPVDTTGMTPKDMGAELASNAISTLGFDPNDIEVETFDCKGGFGGYIPGVDKNGLACLMAIAIPEDDDANTGVVVMEYFPESRAKEAGENLARIRFK